MQRQSRRPLSEHFIDGRIETPTKAIVPALAQPAARYIQAMRESDSGAGDRPGRDRQDLPGRGDGGRTLFTAEKVKRIILARPAVEAGERLGFLPGDIAAKVDPYLRPLYDALYDLLDAANGPSGCSSRA